MSLIIDRSKKIISFDLFDTLICRPLRKPEYLFDILEQEGKIRYRLFFFKWFGFKWWRMKIERAARKLLKYEDVNLFEIYRLFSWIIKEPASVLKRELYLENIFIDVIDENTEFLRTLIKDGYQCCLVSDMYMPISFVRKLVKNKLKIDHIEIFLSSEQRKTKYTGSLFQVVKDYYSVDYQDIHHIGDNDYTDEKIPKSLGITTTKIPSRNLPENGTTFFELFAPKERQDQDNMFFELGYNLVGPCAWMCAQFIKADMQTKDISKVYFGARDGYYFKKAFDLLSFQSIESHYIRLSRRVLYIPTFALTKDYSRLFENKVSAPDFFKRLNMVCPKFLVDKNPVDNEALFIEEIEKQGIESIAQEELSVLKHYLESQNFSNKLAFFDLGWRGTLQLSLEQIFRNKCEIHGYYFGTLVKNDQYKAFYFQDSSPLGHLRYIAPAIPVFEFLFSEPVGSLIHIYSDNEGFSFESQKEAEEQLNQRKMIEQGVESFFADYKNIYNDIEVAQQVKMNSLNQILKKYLECPNEKVIQAFTNIPASHGFANTDCGYLIEPDKQNSWRMLFSGYSHSYWRSAYVQQQQGLKKIILLNYHNFIYSCIGAAIMSLKKKIMLILR